MLSNRWQIKDTNHTPSTSQDKLFKYILTAAKANTDPEEVKQINNNKKRISNDPVETN